MSHKNSLFGASFEQSKRIIQKREILNYQNDLVGSLAISKKMLLFLPVLFLLGLTYAIGVGLPHYFQEASQLEGWQTVIHDIGIYGTPLVEKMILIVVILLFVNLIPKPNLAYQYLFSIVFSLALLIAMFLSILPFSIGLVLEAFGWLGLVLQLVLSLYVYRNLVWTEVLQLKKELYQNRLSDQGSKTTVVAFFKRYGVFLLALGILNRWTMNIGEWIKEQPSMFSFLYGWSLMLIMLLLFFGIKLSLKNTVAVFYFFKYRKEYHLYFKITNEQWYGKWRGKKMDKKEQQRK